MPSRNPYGCVFWPTYLLPFLGRDAAALVRLPLAARGAAGCLRLAGAGVAACVSAAPAFATGAAPPPHLRQHVDLHVPGALENRRRAPHSRGGDALQGRPLVH